MMSARVTVGSQAETRPGSREETRYLFARGLDRPAVWIAIGAPLLATFVVLFAR